MKGIEKLAAYFQKFPGIGPRQAKRFVYFLLRQEPRTLEDMAKLIETLRNKTAECITCHRFFEADGYGTSCDICTSPNRETSLLMIVEKDVDLEAIERSGTYDGLYFVLGGTVPLMEISDAAPLRLDELVRRVRRWRQVSKGHHRHWCSSKAKRQPTTSRSSLHRDKNPFPITLLGRGLSTGSELEYSDRETIRNALQNRK
jgi:recombination protein RecR